MKVENFLKQFKTSTNQSMTCEKRIKTKYVPFLEKLEKCVSIIQRTSSKRLPDSDEEIYQANSPARMVFINLTLIDLYTDIEIDFTRSIDFYDMLEKEDALVPLIAAIPQTEVDRFLGLANMVEKDFYDNNRSLAGYFDHNSRALFNLLEGLVPK